MLLTFLPHRGGKKKRINNLLMILFRFFLMRVVVPLMNHLKMKNFQLYWKKILVLQVNILFAAFVLAIIMPPLFFTIYCLAVRKKPRGRPKSRKSRNPLGRRGRGITHTPPTIRQQTPAHLSARSIKVDTLSFLNFDE